MYAHIHHGAFTYYYRSSQWGLKPPTGGLVGKFIHIAGKDKGGRAHYFSFNEFWQAATVVIYSESSSGSVHDDYEIFSTTIHELGHVAFWEYGYSIGQYLVDYVFRKAIMTESWSMCVENFITKKIYPNAPKISGYDYKEYSDFQRRTISSAKADGYTSLFIDLIDNYNQSRYGASYPKDNVYGYSISQLENALDKTFIDLSLVGLQILEPLYESFAYTTYQNKLINLYNNPTENKITELFDNYD